MDKSQHPNQNQMMLHSPSRQQLNYIPILWLKFRLKHVCMLNWESSEKQVTLRDLFF